MIARLDMERRNYPLTVLHEYRMQPKTCWKRWIGLPRKICRNCAAVPGLRRNDGTGASGSRGKLRELIRMLKPSEIDVSAYGIREGLSFAQMPEKLRARAIR